MSDTVALRGMDPDREAADASAQLLLRMGYLAIASGFVDTAVVVGVKNIPTWSVPA